MKRCTELQPLSREHHTALRLALQWRRVATGQGAGDLDAACQAVQLAYEAELKPHFAIEEAALLPLLDEAGAHVLVARTLIEHRALQRLARGLDMPDPEVLRRFADLLTEHVRFEENELFPAAERLVGEERLAAALAA